MKFDYFNECYTEEHKFLVLKEMREFIRNDDNNIDDFFEQLAKNMVFVNIMEQFYYEDGRDNRHKIMGEYSSELRHLQQQIVNEITKTKEDLNINKLKDFLDREIEKSKDKIKK